ncbi:MAG: hypothetical protein VXZ73_02450 [Pseudomonadota bacterium]|nr:hypothetical protein [Pseudomonadota bacterium]
MSDSAIKKIFSKWFEGKKASAQESCDDSDDSGSATGEHFSSDVYKQLIESLGGGSPYTDNVFYEDVRRSVANGHIHFDASKYDHFEVGSGHLAGNSAKKAIHTSNIIVGADMEEPMSSKEFAAVATKAVRSPVDESDGSDIDFTFDSDASKFKV